MTTPQPGIFHEGTQFHWFLHFRVRPNAAPADVRAAIKAVQAVADAGAPPETVTLVVGFGRSLLARMAPAELPPGLHDFVEITGTSGQTAAATQEDVFFWAHSNRHDRNYEVARDARRAFASIGELARETPSFVYLDSRDLTGFIDGTENPSADEARTLAVLADGQVGEGGSFVLTQRWIHDLDKFHSWSIEDQEAVFGRTKLDSTEIEEKHPHAHLSRIVIEDDEGEEIEIYRRSVPYGTALEAGLYFLAFTDDLSKIDRMLANMYGAAGDGAHDLVVEFSHTVSGAYYFAPSADALARILEGAS
jgi:putative iron-dependent peroxidase